MNNSELMSIRVQTTLLAVGGLLVLQLSAVSELKPAGSSSKPNVLLIIGDDLRDLSALPGPNANRVIMPNLERLAAKSMRFDRAYCQYPVCNPSRTSFLTGLRPGTTGVLDNSLVFRNTSVSNTVTLPQLFRQNGYQTVSLGKVFHNVKPATIDWLSWDVCKILTDVSYATDAIGNTGPTCNPTGGEFEWCYWRRANGNDDNQMDGKITLDATNRLSQKQSKPFFMAVGLNKPHDPYIAPAKYFEQFPSNQINVHVDPANKSKDASLAIPPGPLKGAFAAFTEGERREFLQAYYACAAFEDAQIGRLLDALDRNGWWENTIVIFISDHGYHLGERDWWNKVTIFELCSRVPLYVCAPGMPNGGRHCARLIELIDIYPTLADLAGLPLPSTLPGTSFRPLLANPQLPWKRAAYTQVQHGKQTGCSVRTEQWRYTKWSTGEAELYDHETDPGEWYNLASNPAYSNVVDQLDALLPP